MNQHGYVCLGRCHATITEEQRKNGLTVCGNNACERKSQPFVKGAKCEKCGLTFREGQEHLCTQ